MTHVILAVSSSENKKTILFFIICIYVLSVIIYHEYVKYKKCAHAINRWAEANGFLVIKQRHRNFWEFPPIRSDQHSVLYKIKIVDSFNNERFFWVKYSDSGEFQTVEARR